jgi:hypothetical protein
MAILPLGKLATKMEKGFSPQQLPGKLAIEMEKDRKRVFRAWHRFLG